MEEKELPLVEGAVTSTTSCSLSPSVAGTASGSKNLDGKADHLSSGAAITREEGKGVRLTAAEKQEMNGVILERQRANEADGEFFFVNSRKSKQHVSKYTAQKKEQ